MFPKGRKEQRDENQDECKSGFNRHLYELLVM